MRRLVHVMVWLALLGAATSTFAQESPRPLREVTADLSDADVAVRRRAAWELWRRRADPDLDARAVAAALRDDDGYVRDTCAFALRDRLRAAPQALAPVAAALSDERVAVRRTASDLLPWAYAGVLAVLDPLVAALGDDDAQVRVNAARALAKLPPDRSGPALGALRDALADPFAAVRAAAVCALVSVDPAEGPASGVAALEDPDALVRSEALRVLGWSPSRTAAPAEKLIDLLRDDDEQVRRRAALLLGAYVGDRDVAVPALVRTASLDTPAVRLGAMVALAQLARHDERALPTLAGALWEESCWFVRQGAQGLAAAGASAAPYAPDLCDALSAVDDDPTRYALADAIGRVLAPVVDDALPVLQEAADRRGTLSSLAAAAALVRLRGDAARLEQLVAEVEHGPWRIEAARALMDLGAAAQPALPALARIAERTEHPGAEPARVALRGVRTALAGAPR